MTEVPTPERSLAVIKWLTFLMFLMFAMTTDSVGVIIPEVIKEFHLSMTVGGAFHYAAMGGIAFAGFFLGFLADRLGRKKSIILGLVLFAVNSYLFAAGRSFTFFVVLLVISGAAIGIFKTGALALIGDITRSTTEHTATMNTVEGFFAVGAIIGPAIVARLLAGGTSWKWLYVIAGTMCVVLIVIASLVRYPHTSTATEPVDLKRTLRMMTNPYALGFSGAIFLYVAVESAIYVWMPTLLSGYHGSLIWIATYAISIFFVLRAAGRFIGSWMLARLNWAAVVTVFSFAIFACFVLSMVGGIGTAVWVLPDWLIYVGSLSHTQFKRHQFLLLKPEHGAVAGAILSLFIVLAVIGPLAMAVKIRIRYFGDAKYGFILATAFAGLLFAIFADTCELDPQRHP